MKKAIQRNNSIRTAVLQMPVATASARLEINHPSSENLVKVVVEGSTDKSFYERFLDNTHIIVAIGVNAVEQTLDDIGTQYPELIGIRDADFIRIPSLSATVSKKLFLTDGHDIEMMIALSRNAIERFWEGFFNEENSPILPPKFPEIICRCLKPLSYFRLYNHTHQQSISFDEIDCQKNDGFSCYAHIKKIIDNPQNKDKVPTELRELLVRTYSKDGVGIYELTRGHDFLRVAILQVRKSLKAKISQKNAFEQFYNSFDLADFQATNLCRELQAWCKGSDWCKEKGIRSIIQ